MMFNELHLHARLLDSIKALGFETATPVQEKSIPPIMDGGDVMACAQTGTGKTAAFTLPILHHLISNPRMDKSIAPRALILTPTRELADQVLENIRLFTKGTQIKSGAVVGGVSYRPQIQMMQRTLDVLVATPGRLIDHMGEGRIDLSKVEIFVLDEADRMLDMGFVKPVEQIIEPMPNNRQTLLFSATFDTAVERLAKRFLNKPIQISLAASTKQHKSIKQSVFFATTKEQKNTRLEELLKDEKVWQAIIFMKTKHSTETLAKQIQQWGHEASALNGDMRQNVRKRVVEKMHSGKLRILVATDVAARGLDVKALTHVVNYDLPQVPEDYTHRIGRTGRAGATGEAISFISRAEMGMFRDIERLIGQKIEAENDAPAPSKAKGKPRGKNISRGGGQWDSRKRSGGFSKPSSGRSNGSSSRFGRTNTRDNSSKPYRSFNKPERSASSEERSLFSNHPASARSGGHNDKPKRNFDRTNRTYSKSTGSYTQKPNRSFNKSEGNSIHKPRSSFNRSSGKDAGSEGRTYSDRPARNFDKPRRSFNNSEGSSDRPNRNGNFKPKQNTNRGSNTYSKSKINTGKYNKPASSGGNKGGKINMKKLLKSRRNKPQGARA